MAERQSIQLEKDREELRGEREKRIEEKWELKAMKERVDRELDELRKRHAELTDALTAQQKAASATTGRVADLENKKKGSVTYELAEAITKVDGKSKIDIMTVVTSALAGGGLVALIIYALTHFGK